MSLGMWGQGPFFFFFNSQPKICNAFFDVFVLFISNNNVVTGKQKEAVSLTEC